MDHAEYRDALAREVGLLELPFAHEEYASRLAAVRAAMDAAGIDVLLVTDVSDIFYLTGYSTFEVSVHTCLSVSPRRTVLQVPSIETGPAVTGSLVDEVIGYRWEGPQSAVAQLADAIHGGSGRDLAIGCDDWHPSLRAGFRRELAARMPKARFVDSSGLLDSLRIVKSEAELAMLSHSARLTEQGLDAAMEAITAGATDSDVAAAGAHALLAGGSEFMSMQPIVTTGLHSSIIHTNHQRRTINAGDPVFMEFGATWHRYTAPLMRTAVAGQPTGRMEAVFETLQTILESLTASMRPGEPFCRAAEAADAALAPLADSVFFSGVWGYSVGAQFPPSWVEGSGYIARGEKRLFEENMVFHLPLCLRVPGQWGIGFSETVRVGADGGEPLTRNRWTLSARP